MSLKNTMHLKLQTILKTSISKTKQRTDTPPEARLCINCFQSNIDIYNPCFTVTSWTPLRKIPILIVSRLTFGQNRWTARNRMFKRFYKPVTVVSNNIKLSANSKKKKLYL